MERKKLPKTFIMMLLITSLMQLSEYGFTVSFAHADKESYSLSGLRLSGYGTISHTFDDRDDMQPMRDISKSAPSVNSYDINSTWRMDSRLGLQADYQFNPNVECIIQGVLRDHADPTFTNSIELAYVGFRPFPQLNVRAGRVGYDAFLMSDIRHTGYAYLWVRPPVEFYSQVPVFSLNGADISYNIDQGDVQWRIKAQGGKSYFAVDMDRDTNNFETGDLCTLTLTRQSGPFKIKAGYSQFTSLNEAKILEPLHAGLEAMAAAADSLSLPDIKAEALSLRNEISFKDNDVSYMTLGTSYDDGTLIAQAEIGRTAVSRDFMPNGEMGYLSIGYRVEDFTPYCTLSFIEPGAALNKSISDWSALEAEPFHSQIIDISNSTRGEQYTYSLGLRWDFNNQAALKLQWDNAHIQTYGYSLWLWQGETFTRQSTANLYTLSMEFVF